MIQENVEVHFDQCLCRLAGLRGSEMKSEKMPSSIKSQLLCQLSYRGYRPEARSYFARARVNGKIFSADLCKQIGVARRLRETYH